MSSNKELTFDDFKKMAANPNLSGSEKIGFPDTYRKGFSKAILEDIYTKLPIDKTQNKIIIDIGSGCDELTLELIKMCEKNSHTLVLIDSDEMLAHVPNSKCVVKIGGKFPFSNNELKDYIGKSDFVLCYSVLFYIFANDNMYLFLHEALNLLKPNGRFLIGDIPNIDKRDRFLDSEEGKKFLSNNNQIKGSTAHDNRDQKMDDSIVLAIVARLRRFGCEAYLVPQNDNLPMANRREDILVVKR
ncbi:MAG: class I SAM-dependent methyltransferase [Bacteroidetes bacterium]|nr:class I SAM-dependent methyltransferase [Bacteroidota bacterium]